MKKNILIVDDSHTVRLYYRQILEPQGYELSEAANGSEGLEKALTQDFDLFIVDINMPMMDGYTFLGKLRNISSVPVLMISNEDAEHDAQRAYEMGANFYMIKPVDPSTLLLNINMLIGGHT